VLHQFGINYKRMTFQHNGIDRRLTDVHGNDSRADFLSVLREAAANSSETVFP
jgi:hypothetical protein